MREHQIIFDEERKLRRLEEVDSKTARTRNPIMKANVSESPISKVEGFKSQRLLGFEKL